MHEEVPEGRDRITELKYERIQLQQKTFTKWMNAFLEKSNNLVTNIFQDLADGVSLLKLLEEITGEKIGNARKKIIVILNCFLKTITNKLKQINCIIVSNKFCF